MSASSIAPTLFVLCFGLGALCSAPAPAAGGGTAAWDAIGNFNPVVPGYFADPTLKKFGDTYYLYSSTDGIGACEGWTQVWISKDMVNWVNYKMDWNPRDKNWAPDCMEKDGKYYLFYNYPCMTFAAEGSSPVGPWTPYESAPLIPDKFVPPVITLDFQSFEDDDGSVYGYFTTWAGLQDAGTGWVKFNDDMKTFASKGRIPYHELEGIMEGPYMLKRNGKYYMMYSNASCHDETYNVRYSINDAGPTAATGWVYGENNPILSSDVARKIHGTGHHSVLQEGDDYFMIYHRHDIWVSAGGLTRQTCIDRMHFTDDGQIEKVLPTHQGVGYFGGNQNKFPNLARGASVVASSHEGTYFPRYAADDNNATLWRAETGRMDEWIEIDMGSVREVRRTHLQFEYPEHVYQYLLEYSADRAHWKVFADKRTNQKPGCPMVDDNDVAARYFRVTITNMEPIKNVGRRAGVWNFKAFSGVDPDYEALIRKYVNADIDPALPPLLIEAGAGYGGAVSPSGTREAWPGSDHDFTITPNPGFAIADVLVDGKSVGAVSSYSLKGIDGGHEIFVRFKSEDKESGSVPRTGDLLFSCLAGDLPEEGKIASWPTQFPKGGSLTPMSNPAVTQIDGRKFASVNAAEGDGFRFGSARTEDIECDGFTIVAAVRHRRHSSRDAWDSVVDLFYDRLQLGVYNWNGTVYVRRNGQARTSDFALADGQIAVLSLVVQPDGTWRAFADNREIMSSDSVDQMTKLVPGVAGDFGRGINLGRNEPDAWSTFNGEIGDVFLYKVALSDAERRELVNHVAAKLVGTGGAMNPFPLSQVRLGAGVFKDSMEVNRRVLDGIGADRALYCFRFNAGLDTKGAKPLESWATPEPGGAFPGFFEGHYLSAISLMHAQAGDPELRVQVDYMVGELAKCQEALGGAYLFASPAGEFAPDRLDGVVWYRMHKLMEGLLAAHRDAGNAQALVVLNKLAAWIDGQMRRYGDDLEKVKKVEYGGMTEALENLYELTRDPRHREMAHAWEQREHVLDTFHSNEDFCEHANTLLAKMVGAARIAEVEGDAYHLAATRNFWDLVAGSGRKTYATGGTSVHEGMPGVGALANTQSRMAQETCVSYNLQKVTQSLFHLTGEAHFMDYFERQLFNAILGSQDPVSGWKTYYQPLNANTVKDFRSNLTGCYCCNGTGLENPSKYGGAIYSHDDAGLRVNLFIASTVDWPEQGVQVEQVTRFPEEAKSTLTVRARQPVLMDIGVRVPGWCRQGFSISVNGVVQRIEAVPSSYASISRTWKSGDRIEVVMPMAFSAYPMPDRPSQLAFLFGPLVMVGEGARPWLGELVGDPDDPGSWTNRLGRWFAPVPESPLRFTARDDAGRTIRFKPYYQVGGGEFFTGYWDVVKEPAIVDDHNLALGKRTICAQPNPPGVNVECFLRAEKAVDGQYGGDDDWYVKWFPNGMPPQWITVDLGGEHAVTAVEWFPAKEDIEAKVPYRYTVEHSRDNESWQPYAGRPDNEQSMKSYRDERAVTARYLRLTILPQPGLEGNAARPKVAEFKVFGPQGG